MRMAISDSSSVQIGLSPLLCRAPTSEECNQRNLILAVFWKNSWWNKVRWRVIGRVFLSLYNDVRLLPKACEMLETNAVFFVFKGEKNAFYNGKHLLKYLRQKPNWWIGRAYLDSLGGSIVSTTLNRIGSRLIRAI